MLKRENHKPDKSKEHLEFLKENFDKEVSSGLDIPVPKLYLKDLKSSEVTPLDVQVQGTINDN